MQAPRKKGLACASLSLQQDGPLRDSGAALEVGQRMLHDCASRHERQRVKKLLAREVRFDLTPMGSGVRQCRK